MIPRQPMHPKATIRRAIADVLAYTGPARRDHLDDDYLGFDSDSRDTERSPGRPSVIDPCPLPRPSN